MALRAWPACFVEIKANGDLRPRVMKEANENDDCAASEARRAPLKRLVRSPHHRRYAGAASRANRRAAERSTRLFEKLSATENRRHDWLIFSAMRIGGDNPDSTFTNEARPQRLLARILTRRAWPAARKTSTSCLSCPCCNLNSWRQRRRRLRNHQARRLAMLSRGRQ